MNIKQIQIGATYGIKNNPCFAKPIKILPGKKDGNPHGYAVVQCEISQTKVACFGMVKYLRLSDLIKII